MKQTFWTEKKFSFLTLKQQHRKAADLLQAIQEPEHLALYRKVESWLSLPPLDMQSKEEISHRFHHHTEQAHLSYAEHNLFVETQDKISSVQYLPIAIYLDHLRSAFNVGSIIRTTEAFRLGSLYFCPKSPYVDNAKVQKTSMRTHSSVPSFQEVSLSTLPRPIIGLETAPHAPTIHEFVFPPSFTLVLGNEEYGLSKETLSLVDSLIQIPLCGSKNSLNVASAYAIAAAAIRKQFSK